MEGRSKSKRCETSRCKVRKMTVCHCQKILRCLTFKHIELYASTTTVKPRSNKNSVKIWGGGKNHTDSTQVKKLRCLTVSYINWMGYHLNVPRSWTVKKKNKWNGQNATGGSAYGMSEKKALSWHILVEPSVNDDDDDDDDDDDNDNDNEDSNDNTSISLTN
jgi:hypothetical protein